jgi:hypothetical protein
MRRALAWAGGLSGAVSEDWFLVQVDSNKTEMAHAKYEHLIARAKLVPAMKTLVVHPCDETSLRGASEAAEMGLITPVLVARFSQIVGYRCLSLIRASLVVNCQSALAW